MKARGMRSYTPNHIRRPQLPPPPAMMVVNAEELASASAVTPAPSPGTTSRRATPKGSFHNDILISNGTEHGLTLLPPNHMSKSNKEIDCPVLDVHISHRMPS
ncbi:hypothetical protein SESBI_46396 [Sesbania bispinosa]|nr:hypothetical protein SESBI_46396 [Sesbania bispinosa]